jgi:hypothetical protein
MQTDVFDQTSKQRNALADQNRHASYYQTFDQPFAQKSLDRNAAVYVKVIGPGCASRSTIPAGVPDICSTTPSTTARSSGLLLRTTTRFSPYGHLPKVSTFSKVRRPNHKRINRRHKLDVSMRLSAALRQEV